MDFGEVVGWTVMRDNLDYLILQKAVRAGASLLEGQRVRGLEIQDDRINVSADSGRFSCLVLVGADGANSIVARDAGLMNQRNLAVALEAEMEVADAARPNGPDCIHLDFGCVPGGYGWVFPKKRVLSVGVGAFRRDAVGLKASFQGFLERLGLTYDPQHDSMRGHFVPLGGRARTLHRGRVLLVGDAASLAEPLTGEGIYYAVKSAKIAAHTTHQALENDRGDLSTYTRRVHEEITQDLKYADRLAALFYRFPRLCYGLFVKSPSIQWEMANVLRGRSSFRNLHGEILKTGPKLLLAGLR
jgi:geranylgeranyl reductase family protein